MGGGTPIGTPDDPAHLAAAINARLRARSRAEDLSWLK
jgi:hypothetical protein